MLQSLLNCADIANKITPFGISYDMCNINISINMVLNRTYLN